MSEPRTRRTRSDFLAYSPSRRDGIDFKTEIELRRRVVKYIDRCGKQMNLYVPLSTYVHTILSPSCTQTPIAFLRSPLPPTAPSSR